ncbi:VCBS repeat-containing protein [Rhodocaloribacter litoris]|uniref:FG-GAP-like repeat-containing protein n=1 Tax=Rhodocaloribacter litoris TaxID=2558931 RepID=UPI001420BAA6|nr:FG-GAP-like repeat-containing protein [Rhodocaloribacter litoris]QXD15906.1 VCBS repeat-containing protein [Rhodocaloribacter litoris]
MSRRCHVLLCLSFLAGVFPGFVPAVWGQVLSVQAVYPTPHALAVPADDSVTVTFSEAVDPATLTGNLIVKGAQSGCADGTVRYDASTRTATFLATCAFAAGETVTVTVTPGVRSAGGAALSRPYTWQFTIDASYGAGAFEEAVLGDAPATKRAGAFQATFIARPFAGDLNGDPLMDLAIVNRAADRLVVYLNAGLRVFTAREVNVGPATGVTGGDFDDDGDVDLVVYDALGRELRVLQNAGNGTFGPPLTVVTQLRPVDLAVNDFDGDGSLDLAVAAFGSDAVALHFNDGTGRFGAAVVLAVGRAPGAIVARDFDNDGALDLAVASQGERQVDILLNDGTGAFTRAASVGLSFVPAALAAGDVFGGDGRADLLVSARDRGEVLGLRNTDAASPPTFAEVFVFYPEEAGGAQDFVLGDFGGPDFPFEVDGLLDLVSTHLGSRTLQARFNAAGTTLAVGPVSAYDTAVGPNGLISTDLDGNGSLDVVVAGLSGDQMSLFFNTGGDPGPLRVAPAELSFGEVCLGETSTQTITVENTSEQDIPVQVEVVGGAYEAGFTTQTLQAGAVVSIPVTFRPGESGPAEGTVRIIAEVPTTVCGVATTQRALYEVELDGSGSGAVLSAVPGAIDMGQVLLPGNAVGALTLTNTGNLDAVLTSTTLDDVNAPFRPLITPPVAIAAEDQVDLQVAFEPVDPGLYETTLRLHVASACRDTTLAVGLRGEALPRQPDLRISSLTLVGGAGDDLIVGDQRQFEALIQSEFRDVTQPFENHFQLTRPDGSTSIVGQATLTSLAAGTSQAFRSNVVSFEAPGDHVLCVLADVTDAIAESDETNNSQCLELQVRVPLPDLVAVRLELVPGQEPQILVSQQRTVSCTFENDGELSAGGFDVALLRNDLEVSRWHVDQLAVGASTATTFEVAFPERGSVVLDCFVDVGDAQTEMREDNNRVTLSLLVEVSPELVVSPNPFTPNGDGINEPVRFRVSEAGYRGAVLKIFNFDGRLLRTISTLDGSGHLTWDGRDEAGTAQPPGVYLYIVEETGAVRASGHVTLAR